jgi:hypothetical protein
MPGKTIGKTLNNGYAGNYARTPDVIIETRPLGGSANVKFGSVLMNGTGGTVVPATASFTAATFAGIASSEVKSSLNYIDPNGGGEYRPKEPVAVFQRGSINAICKAGVPALGGAVYVRIAAGTNLEIGDLTAVLEANKTVLLANAQWGGSADSNGVAELVLLTRVSA